MWIPGSAPGSNAESYVRDAVAQPYASMRPMKESTSLTFPVYQPDDLLKALLLPSGHPDDTVAHLLAVCSAYAYSDADTLSMVMARMGLEENHCREISRSVDAMLIRSTAFVVHSRDRSVAIVCFRGTPPLNFLSYLINATTDAEKIATAGEDNLTVHAGFYRNVRINRPEVIWALDSALDNKAKPPSMSRLKALYFTGHSLGGAMAALMAAMVVMTEKGPYADIRDKLKGVYTFGQPMLGSPNFARAAGRAFESAEIPYIRYVYDHDVVPHLPPKDSDDFQHFGQEYHYQGAGRWKEGAAAGQMRTLLGLPVALLAFVAHKVRWLREVPLPFSFEDHGPWQYLTALTPPGKNEFGDKYFVVHP
jgi:hypothetical protein